MGNSLCISYSEPRHIFQGWTTFSVLYCLYRFVFNFFTRLHVTLCLFVLFCFFFLFFSILVIVTDETTTKGKRRIRLLKTDSSLNSM